MGESHVAIQGGMPEVCGLAHGRHPPARRCCHFESCRDWGMPDACSTLERDAYIASVMVSYTCSALQASLIIMQGP